MRVLAPAVRPEGPERLPALRATAAGGPALKTLLLGLALAALLLAGCGRDDEPADETTPALPNLTVPQGDSGGETVEPPPAPVPDPATETLPPVETVPPSTGGGTPVP